jgi:hypothetical protein
MQKYSIVTQLEELFKLNKSGVITREEYEKFKKQALSDEGIDENPPVVEAKRVKKGKQIWILSIVGIVILSLVFRTTLFLDSKIAMVKNNAQKTLSDENSPSQFLETFFDLYKKKNMQITSNINPEIGVYILTNPGSRCSGDKSASLKFIELPIPEKSIFDKEPKGDKCGGFSGVSDGFYYQRVNAQDLPKFEKSPNKFEKLKLPSQYSDSPNIKVTIIQKEFWQASFYFAKINGKWYLFCQDFCDCSL